MRQSFHIHPWPYSTLAIINYSSQLYTHNRNGKSFMRQLGFSILFLFVFFGLLTSHGQVTVTDGVGIPTEDSIIDEIARLTFPYSSTREVTIPNMHGTQVAQFETSESEGILPTFDFSAGMHLIEINEGEKTEKLKWIIQK